MRKKGFYITPRDALVLLVAAVLYYFNPTFWLLPYVVSHFFIFCNIVRVRTSYELLWVTALVINYFLYLATITPLLYFFILQMLVTLLVIGLEVNDKNYHGIFARRKEQ